MRKHATPDAEILALDALTWLVQQEDAIHRFMALGGIDAQALRQDAESPETGAAVLDFLLRDEELLLGFCDSAGLVPQDVHRAWRHLSGNGTP